MNRIFLFVLFVVTGFSPWAHGAVVGDVIPDSGTIRYGAQTVYSASYKDSGGHANIKEAFIAIGDPNRLNWFCVKGVQGTHSWNKNPVPNNYEFRLAYRQQYEDYNDTRKPWQVSVVWMWCVLPNLWCVADHFGYIDTDKSSITCPDADTLVINWNISLHGYIPENSGIYLRVIDKAGNDSGWIEKGRINVVFDDPDDPAYSSFSVTPNTIEAKVNEFVTVTANYKNLYDANQFRGCSLMINTTEADIGKQAIVSYYNHDNSDKFYIRRDEIDYGDTGTPGKLENDLMILDLNGTKRLASPSPDTVVIQWRFAMKKVVPGMSIYARAINNKEFVLSWRKVGSFGQLLPLGVSIDCSAYTPADRDIQFKAVVSNLSPGRSVAQYIWRAVNNTTGQAISFPDAQTVSKKLPPGDYTIYLKVKDNTGGWSQEAQKVIHVVSNFILPQGSIKINDGAGTTEDVNVRLTFACTPSSAAGSFVKDMRIWQAGGQDTGWIAFTGSYNFTLTQQNSSARVFAHFRDQFDIYSETVSDDILVGYFKPPTVGTVTPNPGTSAAGEAVTISATYADPNGKNDIINAEIELRDSSGKWMAWYTAADGLIHMWTDMGGDMWGQLTAKPGTPGALFESSKVILDVSATTVESVPGDDNTLKINWRLIFKKRFAGKKEVCLGVLDKLLTGQQGIAVGTWEVIADNHPPQAVNVTPSAGSSRITDPISITTDVRDPDGIEEIKDVQLWFGELTGDYVYVWYDMELDALFMHGAGYMKSFRPGTREAFLENDFAVLDCERTSIEPVASDQKTLRINWSIRFKDTFIGEKNVYVYTNDRYGGSNGPNPPSVGIWKIDGCILGPVTPDPVISQYGEYATVNATFSATDGRDKVSKCFITIGNDLDSGENLSLRFSPSDNRIYFASDTVGRGHLLGEDCVMADKYGSIDCKNSFAVPTDDGKGYTLTLRVALSYTLPDTLDIFTAAVDTYGYQAGYSKNGSWTLTKSETVPPTGSISINGGAKYADSGQVTLSLPATDNPGGIGIGGMRLSNDGKIWSEVYDYRETFEWKVTEWPGKKKVYVKYTDMMGNWSDVYSDSIILPGLPPLGASRVNEWAFIRVTYTDTVGAENIKQCNMIANGPANRQDALCVIWQPPSSGYPGGRFQLIGSAVDYGYKWWPEQNHILSNGYSLLDCANTKVTPTPDGKGYTIDWCVMFKQAFKDMNEIPNIYAGTGDIPYSEYQGIGTWIIHDDSTPPAGSIDINNGAVYAGSRTVTLGLSALDEEDGTGVVKMKFSNDNIVFSEPERYATTKEWDLTAGNEDKTVYVKFADLAGNWSETFSDSIILFTPPQAVSIAPVNSSSKANAEVSFKARYKGMTAGGHLALKDCMLFLPGRNASNSFINACYVKYVPENGKVYVLDDSGSGWGGGALAGSYDVLENSQVSVNCRKILVMPVDLNTVDVTWNVKFKRAFIGQKRIGIAVKDMTGLVDVQEKGAWTIEWDDAAAPDGSISIEGGALKAFNRSVTLTLSATDNAGGSGVTGMMFSDNGADFTAIEAFSASKSYMMSAGEGRKTVYVKYVDAAGNVSAVFSDDIELGVDNLAPTGLIKINGGEPYAYKPGVILALSATDNYGGSGLAAMMFSMDGTLWTEPEVYSPSKAYTLPSTDGTYIIYAKFIDATGNISGACSSSIVLRIDTTPPTGEILINDGAGETDMAYVRLSFKARDMISPVVKMRISSDSRSFPDPEQFVFSKTFDLPAGNGTKYVFVKFIDSAGNESETYGDSITLNMKDTTAPSGSICVNDNAPVTETREVRLSLSASDNAGGSGIYRMKFSDDGSAYTAEEDYAVLKQWTLAEGEGQKMVYVKYSDKAGNWSQAYSSSIMYGSMPRVTGITPVNGSSVPMQQVDFTVYYTNGGTGGGKDITKCVFWVAGPYAAIPGAYAFYAYYDVANNKIYLMNDISGTSTGRTPGAPGTMENSQGILDCGRTQVSNIDDRTIMIKWSVKFKEPLTEPKNVTRDVITYVRNKLGLENIETKGTWSVLDKNSVKITGSVTVNQGTLFTCKRNAKLSLWAQSTSGTSDGLMMKTSNDGLYWSQWHGFAPSLDIVLPAGSGTKTVHAKFKDADGNESDVVKDTIELYDMPGMAMADIDGTGKDDLVMDLGQCLSDGTQPGIWIIYGSGRTENVCGISCEGLFAEDMNNDGRDDLVMDFGAQYGLYVKYTGGNFRQVTSITPEIMVLGNFDNKGGADIVGDFGDTLGVWTIYDDMTCAQVCPISPDNIIAGDFMPGGADELILDYGNYAPAPGTYLYINKHSPFYCLFGGEYDTEYMIAADMKGDGYKECIVDFGPETDASHKKGLWAGTYTGGGANFSWEQIAVLSPEIMTAGKLDGNDKEDLVIDFGNVPADIAPQRVWMLHDRGSYEPLSPAESLQVYGMVTGVMGHNGRHNAVMDFGCSYGIWMRKESGNFVKVSDRNGNI